MHCFVERVINVSIVIRFSNMSVFLGVGIGLEGAYLSFHLSQLGVGLEDVVAERVYLLLVDNALLYESVDDLLFELWGFLVLLRLICSIYLVFKAALVQVVDIGLDSRLYCDELRQICLRTEAALCFQVFCLLDEYLWGDFLAFEVKLHR